MHNEQLSTDNQLDIPYLLLRYNMLYPLV